MLRRGQLLVLLAEMQLLLDRQKVLNRVEVVLHLVEDASNVEYRDCPFAVVFLLRVVATIVLKQEQVVVEGLETLIRILLALCAVFADELEELEVAVDGKVFALNDGFLRRLCDTFLLVHRLGHLRDLAQRLVLLLPGHLSFEHSLVGELKMLVLHITSHGLGWTVC